MKPVPPPPPIPEQIRCCLGYVPRPPDAEGKPQPARRPYDCTHECKDIENCIGKNMKGYKK